MNQKATSRAEVSGRGRPIAFDREAVIDRAVEMFWTSGFDASSLDDLVGGLGISRSTLYNSFGGKDGLHQSALDQYLERVERVIVHPLRDGTEGLSDVAAFIDRVDEVVTSASMPAGCLVLNDMAAPRNLAGVDRYLTGLQAAIAACLGRAAAGSEIDESTIESKAAVILSTVIAANHVAHARTHVGAGELIDGLRCVVSGWMHT